MHAYMNGYLWDTHAKKNGRNHKDRDRGMGVMEGDSARG